MPTSAASCKSRWRDLTDAPLFLDDTAGVNLMDVHAKLRRMKSEHGLSLVVIDYLQLMSSARPF